jgi:hypothetical protein
MKTYTIKGTEDYVTWYKEGTNQLHRTDGPAVEYSNGTREWWVDGKLHRTDGPAIERSDGYKAWYLNGKRHRLDGPAVEWPNGHKEWWGNGVEFTEEQFNKYFLFSTSKNDEWWGSDLVKQKFNTLSH